MDAGMADRFDQGFVGFCQIDVFPDHADRDFPFRMFKCVDQLGPHRQIGRWRIKFQFLADNSVQSLVVEHLRNLVNGISIPDGNDRVFPYIGKQGYLGAFVFRNRPVGAAEQRVRINADFAQFLDTVLGRFRFQFTGGGDIGNQRQVNENRRILFGAKTQLACRFQKRQRFDIADGTTDFD